MKNLAISNGLWNGLANATGIVTSVLGSILVVRSLSTAEYGEFSYYIWLAGILGILGTLSFPNAVTKITSELRGNGEAMQARYLAILVALGVFLLNLILAFGLAVFALSQPVPQRIYLMLTSLILIPNGLTAVMRSTLWGKQTYQPVTLSVILASLFQFALIIWAYAAHLSVSAYIAAILSGYVCQVIVLVTVMLFMVKNPFDYIRSLLGRLKTTDWRHYFAFAFPVMFQMVFEVVVWQRSEIFFLKRLSSIEQIGYYNLAYTFFGMFLALGWALINGYYPAISHDYGAKDWTQVQHKVHQGALFAVLFSLPVAFGGWATAPRLINLLYGAGMQPAVAVARIVLLGLIPGTIAGLAMLTISAIGGIWINVRIGAVVALLNIALDIILIPGYGALGASIANTVSQAIYAILVIIALRRIYNIRIQWKALVYLSALSIGLTLFIPLMIQGWLPGTTGLIIAILVSALVYFAAIWKLGYLPFADPRRMVDLPA